MMHYERIPRGEAVRNGGWRSPCVPCLLCTRLRGRAYRDRSLVVARFVPVKKSMTRYMTSVVPQSNHWLSAAMFVAQCAQTGRAQQKEPAAHRFEPEPPGGEYTEEMPA